MFISHRCRFIIFTDPCEKLPWLEQALARWTDEDVSLTGGPTRKTPFFAGMSPREVRIAFQGLGLDYDSYTRIAIVQNPFRRVAAHYDRLRAIDPVWRLRVRAGLRIPDFRNWLLSGQFEGGSLLQRLLPPRHGLTRRLVAQKWQKGDINSFVRAEYAAADLRAAFRKLAVVPAIDLSLGDKPHRFPEILRYDRDTVEVVQRRFRDELRFYSDLGAGLDLVA